MKRSIYKYHLPEPGQTIKLPANITPRHVAMQDGKATLWAEVNHDDKCDDRMTVYSIGTGWEVPEGLTYIGTVQDRGGFVWHFYTLPPNSIEPW